MQQLSRTFASCNTETLDPLNTDFPSSFLPGFATTLLLPVSMILNTLDISYEWNKTVFVLL